MQALTRRLLVVALVTGAAIGGVAYAQEEPEEFTFFGETLIDLHMASSHFPIALLLSSAFFDWSGILLRRPDLRTTAFWTHMLGVVSAVVTVILGIVGNPFLDVTGYLASPFKPFEDEMATRTVQHQWIGILSLVIFGLLALWRLRRRNTFSRVESFLFAAASVVGVVIVGAAGYLGSKVMG